MFKNTVRCQKRNFLRKRKRIYRREKCYIEEYSDEIIFAKDNKNMIFNGRLWFLKRFIHQDKLIEWYKKYLSFLRMLTSLLVDRIYYDENGKIEWVLNQV